MTAAPALTILYFADIRFPLERANGIQTAETCHALARRGHDVTLVVRPDTTIPAQLADSNYPGEAQPAADNTAGPLVADIPDPFAE